MRLCAVVWYNTDIFTNQEVKMSKSRFDGGTLGNGRWDEEEHPRGSDGRFAVAGGGGTSRAAQARNKLLANIKRKIENGEPTTDYERELAIKHILPKGERAEFMDDGGEGASKSMSKEKIKSIVNEEAEKIGTGWSTERAVDTLYFRLTTRFDGTGVHVSLLNDRYMIVGGMAFNFPRRHSVGHYTAKVFDENYK